MRNEPLEAYYGLFNDSYPPIIDGVTLTVQNYVKGFKTHGVEPYVVTPWNPESVPAECGIMKYFSLPIWNRHPYRYGYPKLDPFIWRHIRRTPFRIVHAHCPFSSGRLAVYAKKKQHIPLIGTFHSKYKSDLSHSFARTPWMVPIIMKRILDFFNACDEVWIPQAKVEDTVREYGYKGHLEVVPNGNDMASGYHVDHAAARQAIGLHEDEMGLLFVGQHIWEKGIGVIMDALRALNGIIPFQMHFIGNGYALDSLKSQVEQSGMQDKIHIHGMIRDRQTLASYYAASDLFLFPSFYDNAPLVMREAAAFATPAVIPLGSTAAEVIRDNENGFLCERDGKAYANVIRRLYSDKTMLERAGMEARASLVTPWDEVIEEVLDRYNVIINLHSRKS